jgi:hypothetical protein
MISIVRYTKDGDKLVDRCPLFPTAMIGSAFCHGYCPRGGRRWAKGNQGPIETE